MYINRSIVALDFITAHTIATPILRQIPEHSQVANIGSGVVILVSIRNLGCAELY